MKVYCYFLSNLAVKEAIKNINAKVTGNIKNRTNKLIGGATQCGDLEMLTLWVEVSCIAYVKIAIKYSKKLEELSYCKISRIYAIKYDGKLF